MKTKLFVLLASAAMIGQATAGDHHRSAPDSPGPAPARGGAVRSFHPMAMRNFDGNRMMYSGRRFSRVGVYSPSSRYINSNRGPLIGGERQFTRANINRSDRFTRLPDGRKRAIASLQRAGNSADQGRRGNGLPSNWRNHVVTQHSANWHRDWDRSRDHRWHGHHCRFVDGSWVIFDFGFYPWWPYSYPYDYYASDYYTSPYSYDPGYYYNPGYDDPGVYQGEEYYDQNGSDNQYGDSAVADAQKRLAGRGYYRGEIDGILGPETRRAIARFQSNRALRVTGRLTSDTLQALNLQEVAGY